LPLIAALRSAGRGPEAERMLREMLATSPRDAWWTQTEAEAWLTTRRGKGPNSQATCARAAARPKLDGKLDEPLWKAATPIELHSSLGDDGDWPAVAMVAYDQQYLYLAASCVYPPGAKPLPAGGQRPRDADLSRHDRIELLVDVDRDRQTAYRLSIDLRGWTAESFWHDPSWNPTWFVAAAQGDGAWTVEAAIKLDDLVRQPPKSGETWAVGVQRVVPGVGFQSWTQPAAVEVLLEVLGILDFE
jgi:hypothetical protein